MSRRLLTPSLLSLAAVAAVLVTVACSPATGPSITFEPAASLGGPDGGAAADAKLGVRQGEKVIAMNNGGRLPLNEGVVAEVFLAPYPPALQTDMHLYLLDSETFKPIAEADVDLVYDMVFMDHGIPGQVGKKIGDGHYVLPLAFLMYGDWSVDADVRLPQGPKSLEFFIKVYP